MQNDSDRSPADLRAQVSPVSERFAAVELGAATVVFDREEPDRWILADSAVPRSDLR